MITSVATYEPSTNLRLALVGAGSLGSEVCRLLLERRHAQLVLIDPDLLELRNLSLSALFQQAGVEALGLPKVQVLETLARGDSLVWEPACQEIADTGFGWLRARVDVLLSCTDSALSRVETAFAARSLGVPMLDAGVLSHGVSEGRVACFAPDPSAACYLCGLPEARRAELLAFALSPSLSCTVPRDLGSNAMTGASTAIRATAAALLESLDELARAPQATSLARRILPGKAVQDIALTHSPSCPWHLHKKLSQIPWNVPLRECLRPGVILELPWPVCMRARCRKCGSSIAPRRRTAFVRRRLCCPRCQQTGTLEPLETVAEIAESDPVAQQTLRALGLPAEHLYHLRSAITLQGAVRQQSR